MVRLPETRARQRRKSVYRLAGIPMGMAYTMVQPQVPNYLLGDAYGIDAGTWSKLWLKS